MNNTRSIIRNSTVVFAIIVASLAVAPRALCQALVPRFEKFEASFTLVGQSGNPFDPAVNDVEGTFHGPNGTTSVIPAFWDGDRWRIRFAPVKLGRYGLSLDYNGKPIRPTDLSQSSFTCIASIDDGFIRRSAVDVQQFEFDSHKKYYPVGMDVAWINGGRPDFPQEFSSMNAAGMNWARVWMNAWDGKNLEWAPDRVADPPIGTYLMSVAKRWDMIMDRAAANGVYVQMTLQHHGQYTRQTDPNWNENPFNVANGGFLSEPDSFFTDPKAIQLTENKYRYIVARWGYSTHLMSFELFNEVQNIGEARSHFQDVVNWHKTMAAYLRSIDVNHHLLTTSISEPGQPLASIGLDYDQLHTYPPDVVSVFTSLKSADLDVPLFFGEWGYTGRHTPEEERGLFHDGLWSSALMPVAGAAEFWDWDTVDTRNYWPEYSSLTGFLNTFGITQWTGVVQSRNVVDTGDARGDLSFAPNGDWAATTNYDVTVEPDGAIPNIAGISSYVQGNGHRDWASRPIVFHIDAPNACQFQVLVSNISGGGGHIQLSVGGKLAAERDFPVGSGNQTSAGPVSVDVPAGHHDVSLYNSGPDWFTASRITVTNFVPTVAVLAKGNSKHVAFWAYSRDRSAAGGPTHAGLSFPDLAPGVYKINLWDVQNGKTSITFSGRSEAGKGISFVLPVFTGDVAGVVVPAKRTGG